MEEKMETAAQGVERNTQGNRSCYGVVARADGQGRGKDQSRSDGTVRIYTGVVDIGTGAKTTMAMIASKVLRVPLESMKIIWGDTEVTPFTRGEVGSMTTTLAGTAVRETANLVKAKLLATGGSAVWNKQTRIGLWIRVVEGSEKANENRRRHTKVGL